MSSSSSTTPARKQASITRTAVTWVLLGIWVSLIGFAIVCISGPAWLDTLARKGTKGETYAYKHFGDNEYRQGRYSLAITQYLRAIQIRNDEGAVWVNLGIAYLRSGQIGPAENALNRALSLEQTPHVRQCACFYLGELNEAQTKSADAERYYREALALGARPDAVYRGLGLVSLDAENYESANECFEKALEGQLDPLNPYRDMLVRAREDFGTDPKTAAWIDAEEEGPFTEDRFARYDMKILHEMLEVDPEIAKTQNHLGVIDYRLGQRDQAEEHFQRSLQIWPDNPDAKRILQGLRSGAGQKKL